MLKDNYWGLNILKTSEPLPNKMNNRSSRYTTTRMAKLINQLQTYISSLLSCWFSCIDSFAKAAEVLADSADIK